MKKLAIIGGGVMATYFGAACHRLGYEGHYFSMPDGKVDDGIVDVYHEINIFEKEKIIDMKWRRLSPTNIAIVSA